MAQLVLSNVGSVVGGRLLPNGVAAFGAQISGAAIGQAVGSVAGAYLDARYLTPPIEGPRISEFHVTQSREGASVPVVYGRMRVGGQVIWAARFKERREESGGKGGPRVREYSYSLSFAVALGAGEVARVARCWANGAPFDLSKVTWRFYPGSETQQPDPLIEAVEGEAPAYRGVSYVVFEDLPVDEFGARMPQMSFEIVRPAGGGDERLEAVARAVNVIPGSGEFALSSEIVRRRTGPGVETPENVHGVEAVADFEASIDQLEAELPGVSRVNLVVGWFGDDLRCGVCRIRPGVEIAEKETVPVEWSVAGVTRGGAYLVSQDGGGSDSRASYGGTPSDESVREAIRSLKARGFHVTVYPFVFMDVPAGNGLDDPYGGEEQAAFPWRGRVTCHPAPGESGTVDGTSGAVTQVAAFFDGVGGYDAFVSHYAGIADEEGADGFLIGSEMVGLTRVRDGSGAYPAVARLKALAASVRSVLGGGPEISYAADWTEYGAHVLNGGDDVAFPLDELWADAAISYVGLDWYPPMGDWRDGAGHADAAWGSAHDVGYLSAQVAGGEGFDWYYADDAGRAAQERLAISDGAYGEPWVFRQKDVTGWWSSAHHPRVAGVRSGTPTSWAAGSKPVRFVEFGVPAVNKGANQPNVFFDPKSSESALPHYSDGSRDDLIQRRANEAFHAWWSEAENNPVSVSYGGAMVPADGIALWCWDARVFPAFPARDDVWSDGGNWRLGHWLNGRVGLALLPDVVRDVCARAGVEVDVSGLGGLVTGYRFDGPVAAKGALAPLVSSFGMDVVERDGGIAFQLREGAAVEVEAGALALMDGRAAVSRVRAGLEEPVAQVRLGFVNVEADHAPGVVVSDGAPGLRLIDVSLAQAMDEGQALRVANALAGDFAAGRESVSFALPYAGLWLEPGDRVSVGGEAVRVLETGVGRVVEAEAVRDGGAVARVLASVEPVAGDGVVVAGEPDVVIVDAPALPGADDDVRPLVFAYAEPWVGPVVVSAGMDATQLTERGVVERPCRMGRLAFDLYPHVSGRWQDGEVWVDIVGDGPSSRADAEVLNGANAVLVEWADGWELLQFAEAELVSAGRYRLSRLLRGQQGTEWVMSGVAAAGARVLFLTGAEARVDVGDNEVGAELVWRAWRETAEEGAAWGGGYAHGEAGLAMWSPAHLKARWAGGDIELSWIWRARKRGDAWTTGEPVHEISESYEVSIREAGELVRGWTSSEPAASYAQSLRESDFPGGGTAVIEVAQLGFGGLPGRTASIEIVLPTP